ncbi:MAG: CoA transferase [Acidimicrobiales bacterium]
MDDLLVVDLSRVLAGPYATMLLGDMGARVIKVERPDRGDDTRAWGPPFVGPADQPESTYYLSVNRNKESVVLDLKSRVDREALIRLLERADVLVENFRPGVLDRLGIGHERLRQVNPSLVILSISGFGPDGPDAARPGYDQIVQGEAGLMSLTGEDADHPVRVGVPIADILTGIFGAFGVAAALHQRGRTGRGQVVTTSLLASSVAVHVFQGTRWLLAGEIPRPQGNHHPTVAPYGAFRCRDGMIQIAVGNDALWRSFALVVGLDPDDARFVHNADRHTNQDVLVALIEDRLRQDESRHWLRRLTGAGVPAGEIKSLDQVYASPQVAAQGLIVETEHPTIGTLRLPGPAIRLSDAGRTSHEHPPTLGEHTAAVLAWLDATRPDPAPGRAADRSSHPVRSARELVLAAVDESSFSAWDDEIVSGDPLGFSDSRPYTDRLAEARASSGASESVLTGTATIDGRAVVLIAGEFRFIAGTMGVAAAERIVRALERAEELRSPVLALATSGGARMQEGALALVQMTKTAAAVQRYRSGGGCLIVYLTHPTMGGVLASWGSLGTFQFAMPGALLGYTGPRVVASLLGSPLSGEAQQSETLLAHGLLDDVFPIEELRGRTSRILAVLGASPPSPQELSRDGLSTSGPLTPWESVQRTRDPHRPGASELIDACVTALTPLSGDGLGGGDDASCLAGVCLLMGRPVALVAQVRHGDKPSRMTPPGFRKGRRLLRLAEELHLPVVCVVDTPGPELSEEAETSGLAREIASTLADLSALRVPTVSVLLGEGGGGGAIAFLLADRVVAAQRSWLAPIAPEAASSILYRTPDRAEDVANSQHIAASDLSSLGIVDMTVPESLSLGDGTVGFLARLGDTVATVLADLEKEDPARRSARRRARYRDIGSSFLISREPT